MEQILNKLSEIELTAKRIMEDADSTKSALSAEWRKSAKNLTLLWNRRLIQRFRSSVAVWNRKKRRAF